MADDRLFVRRGRVRGGPPSAGREGDAKAHIAEQAEALVKTISDGRLDRALLSAVASFLHYPAMASASRLAHLLKAVENQLKHSPSAPGPAP